RFDENGEADAVDGQVNLDAAVLRRGSGVIDADVEGFVIAKRVDRSRAGFENLTIGIRRPVGNVAIDADAGDVSPRVSNRRLRHDDGAGSAGHRADAITPFAR